MYLIFSTVLIIVIFFFGNTIISLIKSYSTNTNSNIKFCSFWFISLLIINIILIVFIYAFYYYKIDTIGQKGLTGNKGFAGLDGEECIITDSCNNDKYVNNNKM